MLIRILEGSDPDGAPRTWVLLLLLAVFLIQGGAALFHMSATGDETHYLGIGYYLIKNQRWDLVDTLLQPPLPYYLHGAPLFWLSIEESLFEIPDINARGRAIMALYPDDRILLWARVPILLLATGLGFLVFTWARQAYGRAGGALALFLYAFNPAIIGNAVLITPDLCLAAFSTLTLYLFWRFRNAPRWPHALLTGGALGLALLSKYSAVLIVLALVVVVILPRLFQKMKIGRAAHCWRWGHLALILAAALLVVNAGYFFRGSLTPFGAVAYRSSLFKNLAKIPTMDKIPLPVPAAYASGMDLQHTVVERGFASFLLGQKADKGWLHFYLVAFFLKTPVAFILLLFMVAAKGHERFHWIILVPVILVVLYFSIFRLSRGIRYLLPIYPLLCVWTGQLVFWLKSRSATRALRSGILLLLVWYAASCIRIAPHYLAYFNEIAGGPDNGINLLFESDFDWGQELKGLSDYLRENKVDRVKLGVFTTADPAHYGIKYDPLPCVTPAKQETGLIAVSATALQVWGCHDWLKVHKPVAKVGYTIFIYDIPPR